MQIIGYILALWLIIIIVSSFVNTKFFLCSFLAYFFLVPLQSFDLNFINIPLGSKTFYILCVVGFLLKNHIPINKINFWPFLPFFFLFFSELFLILFQDGYPTNLMLNSWTNQFLSIFILPLLIWNAYKRDPSIINSLRITFAVVIFIACAYGIYLTTMPGINPYLIVVLPLQGSEFNYAYAMGQSGSAVEVASVVQGGRIFGRISSVFSHPMTFGLFGTISVIFLYYQRHYFKKAIVYVLIGLTVVAIIFCGVRSGIFGIFCGYVTYLILTHQVKAAITNAIVAVILISLLNEIPGMDKYLGSIIDNIQGQSTGTVSGSSYSMRLKQLDGCFDIISDCLIQGKGFNWTNWYLSEHIVHPVCLAFESLIFMVLCNEGLAGVAIWAIMIYMITTRKGYKNREQRIAIFTLLFSYIAYACVTGDYNYMKYFMLPYVLILCSTNDIKISRNLKAIKKTSNVQSYR